MIREREREPETSDRKCVLNQLYSLAMAILTKSGFPD